MTTNNNPTPTDHAELRGLCDKWVQESRELLAAHPNDLAIRIAWNHQDLLAFFLRPLLAPALEELDRLRAELAQRKVEHIEDVAKCSATINELRAEVERLKPELSEMTRRMTELACELTTRLVLESERNAIVVQMVQALEEARYYVTFYDLAGRPNELLDQIRAALDAAKGGKS